MILSFHPVYEGDRNLLVAGREPGAEEEAAMRSADAVILPQGCRRRLHLMAHRMGLPVFPNYTARFQYPGKSGQIRLFRQFNIPHPATDIYADTGDFYRHHGMTADRWSFTFPLVLKYDWGGEGHTVHRIDSAEDLQSQMRQAEAFEKEGLNGFILQKFIPCRQRVLRVVVIGSDLFAYWRIHSPDRGFKVSAASGARIDHRVDIDTKRRALDDVGGFCGKTGINLAGIDMLFPEDTNAVQGRFLEVNYFFGRRGLGGSEKYYRLLTNAVDQWLASQGLSKKNDIQS